MPNARDPAVIDSGLRSIAARLIVGAGTVADRPGVDPIEPGDAVDLRWIKRS